MVRLHLQRQNKLDSMLSLFALSASVHNNHIVLHCSHKTSKLAATVKWTTLLMLVGGLGCLVAL